MQSNKLKIYRNGEWVPLLVGNKGYTGSIGYTGSQGIQGLVGYTGSIGYTGSQGIVGYTGSIGDQYFLLNRFSYQPSTSTTLSTTLFATKGIIVTARENRIIVLVSVYLGTGQTVRLGIAELASANPGTVVSVLYNSPEITTVANGYREFIIPNISLTQNAVYGFYITRTDGDGTAIASIPVPGTPSSDSNGHFTHNGSIRIDDNNITGGESLFLSATSTSNFTLTTISGSEVASLYTGGYTGSQGYTGSTGMIDPARKWEEYTDLIGHNGVDGFVSYTAGTAAAVTFNAATPGHPGVVQLSTGTTSTGQAGILKTSDPAASNLGQIVLGGGEMVFEALVEIPVLWTTGVQTGFLRAGFMDEISGAPANGVHMQYQADNANWYLFNRSAGSSTIVTGVSAVTAGWHYIKIVINAAATQTELYVDGVFQAVATTNIPSIGVSYGANIQKGVGTTSFNYNIDMFRVYQTFTTPRY